MPESFIIKKSRPLFRPTLRRGPAHPLGDRVIVREFPAASTTEGGLAVAEVAKKRYFAGELIAAGDQAADKLYDLCVELGDEIWYGQYAGLVEEWQHLVSEPTGACSHDGAWDIVPRTSPQWSLVGVEPSDNTTLRTCRSCSVLKLTERIIVLNVDDLVIDVDLQERIEAGLVRRRRGKTPDGKTRYYMERVSAADSPSPSYFLERVSTSEFSSSTATATIQAIKGGDDRWEF